VLTARALTFNHAGTYYIESADTSDVVKYFQANMNNLTAWPAHREAVRGLSFSPDSEHGHGQLRLYRARRLLRSREERVLTDHGWDVIC
jgi:polyadenylation factor subunit 2